MILHIFNKQEKFSKGYFQLLYDNGCDLSSHELFHYGKKFSFFENLGLTVNWSASFLSPIPHILLLRRLFAADKIIIHCLASPVLMLYILLFPKVAKKCIWKVWGKDVYFGTSIVKKSALGLMYEQFRKIVIPNIPVVASGMYEDYQLLISLYKINPKFIEMRLGYPYSVARVAVGQSIKKDPPYVIQVGNSGSRTNQHVDCYERISKHLQFIEKIYSPLSYGANKKYYDEVCDAGKKILGEKYVPMLEFLAKDTYYDYMKKIDIIMMNHNRQEAVNTILSALYMKKTVYIRSDQPLWHYFKRGGIEVKDILEIETSGISMLPASVTEQNFLQTKMIADSTLCYKSWVDVFNFQM